MYRLKTLLLLNVFVVVVFILAARWGDSITNSGLPRDMFRPASTDAKARMGSVNSSLERRETKTIRTEDLFPTDDVVKATVPENRSKITHIGFLKVHKAGSTTMQNILFRFGVKHNLTFVIPTTRNYFLKASATLPVAAGSHRDILACHSVYSRELYRSVLPNDTINIAIIRDPLQRMISAAYYYRDVWHSPQLMKVPYESFIHSLILRPDIYDPKLFSKTRNAMGKDFGFPNWIKETDKKLITAHLNMLKTDFKLVMDMERFEESLVLLKRDLNWSLSDIVYLQTNSHNHKPVVINATEKNTFKSTCFLDYAVYNFFIRMFDERVRREGKTLKLEVDHYKNILGKVQVFCSNMSIISEPLGVQSSKWNEPFQVTYEDCSYMKMREMLYLDYLKVRHISMARQ